MQKKRFRDKSKTNSVRLLVPRGTLTEQVIALRTECERVKDLGFPIKAAKLEGKALALENVLMAYSKDVYQPLPNEVQLHARFKLFKQFKRSIPKLQRSSAAG